MRDSAIMPPACADGTVAPGDPLERRRRGRRVRRTGGERRRSTDRIARAAPGHRLRPPPAPGPRRIAGTRGKPRGDDASDHDDRTRVLTGYVTLSGNAVTVQLACAASGSATLLGVKTTYHCKQGRSIAKFVLPKAQSAKIPRLGGITAKLTVVEKGTTEHLTVSVSKILPAPGYWTSNFGLVCNAQGANVASLVAPNFSASLPTTIDVRPWLAWYTSATGWQWLGSQGPGRAPGTGGPPLRRACSSGSRTARSTRGRGHRSA